MTPLSMRQKQYILDNCKDKSAEYIAKHLGLTIKEVQQVIDETYGEKKQQSYSKPDELPEMEPLIKSKTITYILLFIGLAALFFAGYCFRMYPMYKHPNMMLDYDYPFHLRMTEDVLKDGKVPAVDKFAWYPEGKQIPENLPVFLYYLGAGFHKIYDAADKNKFTKSVFTILETASNKIYKAMSKEKVPDPNIPKLPFTPTPVQNSIVLFYGIFCSLTMIPVFLLLKAATKKNYIAFIGASLSALMPGHIVRTFASRYRYEGPGVFFLLFNIYFFIKAVEEENKNKFYIYSILSALFMMLSVASWRVSLLFPTLYCIVFFILLFLKRLDWKILGAYSIQFAGMILCFVSFRFLSSQNYLFSHNAMLITGLFIAMMLTRWWKSGVTNDISGSSSHGSKFDPILLFIPLFLVVIVPMFHLSTGYESFLNVLMLKIRLAWEQGYRVKGIENILFINTAELASVPFADLFKWDMCSWGGIFIILYPLSMAVSFFMRTSKKEKSSVPEILISTLFISVFLLTLLFYRNKVLCSIFVGLAGALFTHKVVCIFNRFTFRKPAIALLLMFVAVITCGSGWQTGVYISKLNLALRPYLDETLIKLEEINKERLPVLCYWSYGYVVQTYAKSPTYLDGLLESPLVHKRLVEMSQLLLQDDEQKFYDFCKKYGMGMVMVDKYASRTQLYALYAEYDYFEYFSPSKDGGEMPTEKGMGTIRAKLIAMPQSLQKFKLLWSNPRFSIYKIL